LKRRAEALRNNDNSSAHGLLDEVIIVWKIEINSRRDEQMLNKINSGLADTHGMKVGCTGA